MNSTHMKIWQIIFMIAFCPCFFFMSIPFFNWIPPVFHFYELILSVFSILMN